MLKSCKTSTPSNPASVYKKPWIHLNFPKPNGHHPLGFYDFLASSSPSTQADYAVPNLFLPGS